MKKVAFHTLGCKLNYAESSTLLRRFAEKGFNIISFQSKADVYVIHSCIVTQQAERKCIAAVRQAKKRNPEATIAILGCMPQLNKDRLLKENGNIILLDNNTKFNLPEIISNDVPEKNYSISDFIPSWSSDDRTRVFFKIQDGCDYFCKYCTIPFARGRSRSATIEETLKNIQLATGEVCNELVLTGINIGDFGRKNNETLFDLLKHLPSLKHIRRIRLSSIEPDLLTDDIIDLFAKEKIFMPHFHIPLQSGSDTILKKMERKYDTAFFAEKIKKIKEKMPFACIATDIITGFPGEETAHHQETIEFIRNIDISYMHVFTFSERKNTGAYHLENPVPHNIRKKRSSELHQLSEEKLKHFYQRNIGQITDVLFESKVYNGFIFGYSDNYIRVKMPYFTGMKNKIIQCQITGIDSEGLATAQIIN